MATDIQVLADRILAKLRELNLTPREASIDATGKADAIRNIVKKGSMPSSARLEEIAATLQTTSAWLLGRDGAEERRDGVQPEITLKRLAALPKNLPVYGTALGADLEFDDVDGVKVNVEQHEINMVEPIDFMARPTGVAGRKDVYVLIVAGSSMEPRFDDGRRVLVEAKRSPLIGDDVIVQMRQPFDDGERVTNALLKQLVKRKAGTVVLRQFNPDRVFEVPMAQIFAIHRIMPWDEALGF